MELDEVRRVYYETLKELAKGTGKTVEELDQEITNAIEDCKDVEEILIKAAGAI